MERKSAIHGLGYVVVLMFIIVLLVFIEESAHNAKMKRQEEQRETEAAEEVRNKHAAQGADNLFTFDPNTVSYEELLALGVPKIAAAQVIRARERGKTFIVKEDFAAIYSLEDSVYQRLKPYIVIGDEYRPVPREYHTSSYNNTRREYPQRKAEDIHYRPFRLDTATTAYLKTIGFSHRRAEAFLNYRDMRGGLRSIDEVAECYVIDQAECDTLAKYIIFGEAAAGSRGSRFAGRPVDINTADSAALRSIYGIGEKSVVAIMEYRDRLGGFYSVEQIAEVKEVTESNFERILPQICCDDCIISKIDINFADPRSIKGHPYISDRALRKLLKQRQLKGGWSKIEEMVEDEIFTTQEAERLRPYLRFTRDSLQQ